MATAAATATPIMVHGIPVWPPTSVNDTWVLVAGVVSVLMAVVVILGVFRGFVWLIGVLAGWGQARLSISTYKEAHDDGQVDLHAVVKNGRIATVTAEKSLGHLADFKCVRPNRQRVGVVGRTQMRWWASAGQRRTVLGELSIQPGQSEHLDIATVAGKSASVYRLTPFHAANLPPFGVGAYTGQVQVTCDSGRSVERTIRVIYGGGNQLRFGHWWERR